MSTPLSSAQFGPGSQLPMFMTPGELENLDTNDYPRDIVKNLRRNMQNNWDKEYEKNGDGDMRYSDAHPSEVAYGGVDKYLDSLHQQVNEAGGIKEPVMVGLNKQPYVDRYGVKWNTRPRTTLLDGHHRAVVAYESDRLLPVSFWG